MPVYGRSEKAVSHKNRWLQMQENVDSCLRRTFHRHMHAT